MNRNKINESTKPIFIRKFFIMFFVLILLSSYLPLIQENTIAAATISTATNSDISGHWAEATLSRWIEEGNIKGYEDGRFAPEKWLTRGELAALINRTFDFTEKKELTFTDLSKSDWAYEDLAKALQAGYLQGYENGTIRPKNTVSRQEAAVVIARLLGVEAEDERNTAESFSDYTSIAHWSQAAVGNLTHRKIVTGYEDGSFKPLSSLTRAEAVVILDRALAAKSSDAHFNQVGVYGGKDKSRTIAGNVFVSATDVSLENMIIEGDLILQAEIGEGNVFLENVTVHGNTIIRAGGENSIHFTDCVLNKVIIDKKQGSVRVVAHGSTKSTNVIIRSSTILENAEPEGTGFNHITLDARMPAQSVVKLIGSFDVVNVLSGKIEIIIASGVIQTLKIVESAVETKLTVQEQGKIIQLILESVAAVWGKGEIEKAVLGLKAEATKFERAPLKIVRGSSDSNSGNASGNGNNNGHGGETGPVNNVTSVRATNGTITIKLAVYPSSDLSAADFIIRQRINDQSLVIVTPSAITGSAITQQVVISVPAIPYGVVEQQLSYSVSYNNGLAVESDPLTVASGLAIISGGLAQSVIVAPDQNDNAKARAAALKLSKYIKKTTGIELQVLTFGAVIPEHLLPIYVGLTNANNKEHIDELLLEVEGDGFVIDSVSDSITIIGSTDWGTEFGVDEFLEAYVGVRWLMPGADGEYIPQNASLNIPKTTVVQNPSFFSRLFGSSNRVSWAEDNRVYRQISLSHSMFDLFAPSKYLEEHPDWYPTSIPNPIGGWQPCYSNSATADKAIELINQYFTDHPEAISFSISVNDGGGYCEANPSHPGYTDKINSLGMPNMSDIYFKWVQTVAEGVNEQHADKYLSTIAYHETYEAPSIASGIQLPSNVLVYITDERLSWADPVMASKGKQLTERWKQVAPGASFYEYLYGGPYVLPRSYFHQMADNYRYAYETGIQAQTTELAPNFGEGPKGWIAAKLQWDATADVDVLLHDWYINAVGADAAPYLAKYYAHWEDFWQNRIFESDWYKAWSLANPRFNFMTFMDASYLQIVNDTEMAQSRQWLEQAVAKAQLTGTASQLVRAQKLLKSFEYYESSVLTYPGNLEASGAITSESMGISLLNEIISRLALSDKRKELVEEFKSDNILSIEWSPEAYGMMWSGIKSSDIQSLVEWIKSEPPTGGVRIRMNDIIQTEASAYAVHYVKLILAMADEGTTMNTNTSFEQGNGINSEDWWYWLEFGQSSEDNIHRSNEYPRSDDYGLKLNGLKLGGPVYELGEVNAGYHGMSAYYYVPEALQMEGTLQLFIYYNDANGNWLASSYNEEKQLKDAESGWNLAEWVGNIPEKVDGIPVKKLQFGVKVSNLKDNKIIYLDDVDFFRLSDPYIPPITGELPLNQNSSFEIGSVGADDALPWSYWIDGSNKYITTGVGRSDEQHRTGNVALKAESMKAGAVSQIVAVEPGNYRISSWFKTATGGSANGKLKLYVDLLNQNNAIIGEIVMNPEQVGDTNGEWKETEWLGIVPEQISGQAVARIRMSILLSDFAEGEIIYLDDVELFEQEPPNLDYILNKNASFEEGSAGTDDALPWSYWINESTRFATTAINRSNEQNKKGVFSLKADSVSAGAISQIVDVTPGDYQTSLWYKTETGGSTNGKLRLYVDFLNQNNVILGEFLMDPVEVGDTQGEWLETKWKGTVPDSINGQAVTRVRIALLLNQFGEGEVVYLDDMEFSIQEPTPVEDSPLNDNISFEEGSAGTDDALPWSYWIDGGNNFVTTSISRSGEQFKTGDFSLKADGVNLGAISQLVNVVPGDYRMSTWYKTAAGGSVAGKIRLYVDFLNSNNAIIGDLLIDPLEVGDTLGEWKEREWAGTVPTELNGQAVSRIRINILLTDFAESEILYLDDMGLYLQELAPADSSI
ncbi:DUF4838 domain-containing protein [Paenibacillus luteus]|uniref:DUF4838 domain-containing protein n=1 Tax=Paenibacillus luteus TaxID=2545753 RepID=UPI001142D8D8|nr:DUF4838 domain-containing protein [Paenibacillus luteus]